MRYPKWLRKHDLAICNAHRHGRSVEKIAGDYQTSQRYIRMILKEMGLLKESKPGPKPLIKHPSELNTRVWTREEPKDATKTRKCLACQKPFPSSGPWNRRCEPCANSLRYVFDATEHSTNRSPTRGRQGTS